MSQLLTVALAQYPSGGDCMEIAAAAKAAAAEIVVFPEMYSNGYACFDPNDPAAELRWCAKAESLEGDFVGRFREAAKAHRMHVVSTFLERAEPKPFNAASLIIRFCVTARSISATSIAPSSRADAARSSRRATSRPSPAVFGWALMICIDREYPEAARSLSRLGAEIVLVPNCSDLATDRAADDVRIAQARGSSPIDDGVKGEGYCFNRFCQQIETVG